MPYGLLRFVYMWRAELESFSINTQQARFPNLSNTYLRCSFGRKSCTWLNLRNGHQLLLMKPQGFLLQIWVWKRQNVFTSLSYSHGSGRISERIRDCILHYANCQALKKSVYKPGAFYKGILFPLCEVWNLNNDAAINCCWPATILLLITTHDNFENYFPVRVLAFSCWLQIVCWTLAFYLNVSVHFPNS